MTNRSNELNLWVQEKMQEGYSWEKIKDLCSSPGSPLLKQLTPKGISYSDWAEFATEKERADSAVLLVAFFDQDAQNQQTIKSWLLQYTMRRKTDLERIWFTDDDMMDCLGKYAGGYHIAFISLDHPQGSQIGQRLYDVNPDCLICYYRKSRCRLEPLLHSRPYDFFTWAEGEAAFYARLDDMIGRVIASSNVFCYETKKLLYCYPVRNIQYFQSDLKYIHITTVLGNNATIYARMSDIKQALSEQNLLMYFVQIHKSYLVNRSVVREIDKQKHTVLLVSGEELPISDKYYKETIRELRSGSILFNNSVLSRYSAADNF